MTVPFNDIYRTTRWKRVGELTYKYPKYVLICQYAYNDTLSPWMIVCLGAVKQRHDNRWDWWQYNAKSKYWKNETKQGVSNTLEEAQQQVEKGWIDG